MAPSLLRLFAALTALTAVAFAAPAHAQNPYDAEQRELANRAARDGRRPAGAIPLLEIFRNYPFADPAVTTQALERLYADRRLSPARRAYAGTLLARARLRAGQLDASRDLARDLGYVIDFRVIGPFDNEGKRGYSADLPPEAARMEAWDAAARFRGKERDVGWRPFPAEVSHLGYVSFDAVHRPDTNVCSFAETFVEVESERALTLWLGNGGAAKVYWNGELVASDEVYRQPDPDRHVALVAARTGWNRLLVKACATDATWGFFLRIGDADGGALARLTTDSTAPHDVSAASVSTRIRMPRALTSDLAALEAAAGPESTRADALEALARFLAYSGADDPAERRARQLAARAADAGPNVERLRLAARLADERGEAMRFASRAITLSPNDREARMLDALMTAGGPSPEDALPALADLERGSDRVAVEATLLSARVLDGLELVETALTRVARVASRAPEAPGFIAAHAEAAEAAGRADLAIELRRRAVAARWDDTESRRALVLDALGRGDAAAAQPELDALAAILPDHASNSLFLAQVDEGLGRSDAALEVLRRARAVAPEDAGLFAAEGRLLLRLGQDAAAADALRAALALRPQDADVRELLERVHPERRVDEAYAVRERDLLARRVERAGYPMTVLEDLTVKTVYENGLGSSFHQYAAQAHDDEGARQLRSYSIQYDPGSQRVDVRVARIHRRDGSTLSATETFEQQLGEPWYRIYYDTRALVVVFPTVEAGDTVEIQYRIDDVAHRNLFADYYGDLTFFQGFAPVARVDYVLIAPASRQLYFNRPRLRGLRHSEETREGRQIHHYFATNVRPLVSEQGMPGMTEVAPYLHVSTYRTWEDVGRWWWGLIQDQLVLDDHLRGVVRDLVRGAPDLETKVRRIHDWVVANTRYVALEFGIHGYKPYRVSLIAQRGFGDCKDKASLLYAMFREAGIDARIVLVRTRRNGAITDLPASLAVFDHAIAYVPGLDLYIDGTAEHSGTTELPEMDQGVTVLVVGPDDARLTRTPVLPADRNQRVRRLVARLEADGAAAVEVEERVVGADAPGYRSQFSAEGTRSDRFERTLRGIFPGLVLEEQRMTGLDDLEAPVEVRYSARVPQLARRDGSEIVAPGSVLDDLVRGLARNPSRRHPLDLGGTRSYVEERTLHAPRGFSVSSLPTGGTAESDFGRLRLTYESEGGVVRARTEFELTRDRVAPREYAAFRQWVERADALLREKPRFGAGGER